MPSLEVFKLHGCAPDAVVDVFALVALGFAHGTLEVVVVNILGQPGQSLRKIDVRDGGPKFVICVRGGDGCG